MTSNKPLVSILIPAYNTEYFETTLSSAMNQTFPDLEIVVCDDSCGEEIQAITGRVGGSRVRYVRNEVNLGFSGNFARCFRLARGEFIKFLNDDDLLHSLCVERMVAAFAEYGQDVRLVTSKRRIIDSSGQPQQDLADTLPLCGVDALVKGLDVGNLMLQHSINFIGEPTTVMFRKSALVWDGDDIFRFNGENYTCLADVSLWLRLLSAGRAVYLANEFSAFRVHGGQEQKKPDIALRCITERRSILPGARELGFLPEPAMYASAVRSVLRIYQQTLASKGLPARVRDRLAQGHDWLNEELKALTGK